MTETASPEPSHADSAAPTRENDNHDDKTSTPRRESVSSDNNARVNGTRTTGNDKIHATRSEDGRESRRSSSSAHDLRAAGHEHEHEHEHEAAANAAEEPPAKRRRLRDATPPPSASRRTKVESPPWKRVAADGPSSFTEGGRRKSGRINTIPLELQPGEKRITRRSLQQSPPKTRYTSANGISPASQSATPTATNNVSRRPSSSGKAASSAKVPSTAQPQPTRPVTRRSLGQEPKPSPSAHRQSPTPRPQAANQKPKPQPAVGTRRSMRHLRESNDDYNEPSPSTTRMTRIKLKVRQPPTVIPLVHRDQANVRPKIGPTFEEYFHRAADIPIEDGGMLVADDEPKYDDEMAQADAKIILRVELEAEPGGLLAEDRCSVFEPEPEEEPPRQWAHADHLTKAMSNFRRLMLMEQQRHRATAKRLALACEAEWRRRNPQPKTAEEIEQEELEKSRAMWRQVTRALIGTWENVKTEVNRQRFVQWEIEEQRRVKAALNQAVNLSEQKLQARQAQLDNEDLSDDVDEDDGIDELLSDMADDSMDSEDDMVSNSGSGDRDGDGDEDEDESNMSTSDDDEDKDSVLSDEGLTQEQLREKYANLPEVNGQVDEEEDGGGLDLTDGERQKVGDDDTSDESVDMDDDLGSSEDEMDTSDVSGSEAEGSDEEEEEEEDGLPGLLGLFDKSELREMKKKIELQNLKEEEGVDGVDLSAVQDVAQSPPKVNGHVEHGTADEPVDSPALEPSARANTKAEQRRQAPPSDEKSPVPATAEPLDACDAGKVNGVLTNGQAVKSVEDVLMTDAPLPQKEAGGGVPELEITEAPMHPEEPSPETDGITNPTNPPSPSRSQSPRTSDTKPSDVDTASSVELLGVPKPGSRSASPQPSAPRTEIPFLLRGTLREYQHFGLDWLAGLYANNTNGILADEMGLGKTIQTIALLAHLACHHHVWGPHLVIVPTSVMLNWEMEFKKWCPGFKILTYYGNQEERKRKRQGWTNDDVWNICITSYQLVLQDQQVFRRRRWHYMILDEAHNIKNFRSQRWQTLLGFNTHSRLLLTGTPLQNNLTELWSLLYFLAPPENGEGGFADLTEFHNWFGRPESQILESGREHLDDEARAIIAKLHKVLRPYLLRRLKSDVEKQMPAKYEHVEFCRLSKRQRELYDGFLSRTDTRETLASGNYMSIINCLMQLRKVCNHPDLFVDRPIMTSFRMPRSVVADYEVKEQIVRRRLLAEKPMNIVSLEFLNMVPTRYEGLSRSTTDRISQLSSHRILLDLRDAQRARGHNAYTALDPATVKSNIVYLESAARWGRFEELQHCVYLNALRRQQRPIYGKRLVDMLTLDTHRRPYKPRPRVPKLIMSWFEEDSFLLRNAIPTLQQRAASMEMTISKFACVTPAVVTGDMNKFLLSSKGVEMFEETNMRLSAPVKYAPYMPKEAPPDPWHEARMRLTIQFPDKRLLQYDCGKLQALDKLLRKLHSGGHRALIFTQMTKVLDILEQFLNIHGHKYLRLDGATKVEQRQILTDRFNHDTRILCFILSTRSGGLGINLTGADTVIFYDQDWNPAMDKQCQDRCHRIGQTRDVHIYRLISEHTIEANILRKAGQKQMLDDVVIQEGEFTTDHFFTSRSVRDVLGANGEVLHANENDVAANAAVDRVLGTSSTGAAGGSASGVVSRVGIGRALEQAEDTEDVAAARVAEEEIQQDDDDFLEQRPTPGSGISSARQGTPREGLDITATTMPVLHEVNEDGQARMRLAVEDVTEGGEVEYNAFGGKMRTVDEYMLAFMSDTLKDTPLELPRDKKRSKKKGKDTRKR